MLPPTFLFSGPRVAASWPQSVFAARFGPAGLIAAVPTRESIADARAYHDLAKLDLAAVGSDLTRPLIAAAGRQNDRVRLLDRVANGGKRMPDRCLRCEHTMIKIDSKYFMDAPLHLASSTYSNVEAGKSLPSAGLAQRSGEFGLGMNCSILSSSP